MDIRKILGVAAFLVFGAIIASFMVDHVGAPPGTVPLGNHPVQHQAAPALAQPQEGVLTDCGDVLGSCAAQYREDAVDCADKLLNERISENTQAKNSIECDQSIAKMSHECPKGCELDKSSLLFVPGKTETDLLPLEDLPGRCDLSASRPITLRGSCVRKTSVGN